MKSDVITGFYEVYSYPAVDDNAECSQSGEKESQSMSFSSWLCQCISSVGCYLFSDSSGEYPTQNTLFQRGVMINNKPECRISTVSDQFGNSTPINNKTYGFDNDSFDKAYEFL